MEKMKENETVEFKKSTSEIKEAVIAISAILNKHGRGELGERSILRNPIIAEECKQAGVKVEFLRLKSGFVSVFYRSSLIDIKKDTTLKTTLKKDDAILDIMLLNPEVTREMLAKELGLTLDGVKYHIKNLIKSGKVKRTGSKKAGKWDVVK